MKNTDSYEEYTSVPNLALGYTFNDSSGKPMIVNSLTLPVKGSSAGGGYSTTGDLYLFSQALLKNQLLNAVFTKMIMTGKVDDHHKDSKYAYGFMDMTRTGKHIIGHNGGGPGINGALFILPENDYFVIVLGNYSPPGAAVLAQEISDFLVNQ
jgi:D-alanyl-D-alanine carboxypeptidase